MAGKAEGQGKRGGARPGAGRPKKVKSIERRGGKRQGSGRKKQVLDVDILTDATEYVENKHGVGVIEHMLSLLYDPDFHDGAKASIFKSYLDALSKTGHMDNKTSDNKPLAPVIGLPKIRKVS